MKETLADALRRAATDAPDRVLVVDGETRLDGRTLHARATALAYAVLARVPVGSVISEQRFEVFTSSPASLWCSGRARFTWSE